MKPYVVSQLTSKAGKPWTKIKFDAQNGQMHKVLSVRKNDYADAYGNVSYNLEIEPSESVLRHSSPVQNGRSVAQATNVGDTWRQHLMRAANLLAKCHEAAKAVGLTEGEDARSLFIDASRNGYIAAMPAKPMTKESQHECSEEEISTGVCLDEPLPEDMVDQEF